MCGITALLILALAPGGAVGLLIPGVLGRR